MASEVLPINDLQNSLIKLSTYIEYLSISVTIGCGGSSSENCTYFEVSAAPTGPCNGQVCKSNSNICQVSYKYLYTLIKNVMKYN